MVVDDDGHGQWWTSKKCNNLRALFMAKKIAQLSTSFALHHVHFFQLFPMAHVLKKTNSIAFSAMMEKKNF
jgi:hypothetical protein